MLEGDNRFVRIHRSTVVNVTYIEKIKKGNESKVVLKNGIELDSIPEKLKNIL